MKSNELVQLKEHYKLSEKLRVNGISWKIFCFSSYIVLLNKIYGWKEPIVLIQEEDSQKAIQIKLMDDMSFMELCNKIMECLKEDYPDKGCQYDDRDIQAIFLMYKQQSQIEQLTEKFSDCLCMACSEDSLNLSYQFKKMNTENSFLFLMEQRFEEISMQYLLIEDLKIKDISIIGKDEDTKISSFAKGDRREIPDKTFHKMFEEQVIKSPNKIAVICGEDTITYNELNKKANQLAKYIEQKIVGNENLIGIYMERSIKFIVSILGIIKSGNAYVPIDQDTLNPGHRGSFPKSRLNFMLNDTEMKLVITKKAYYYDIPHEGREILCLDDDGLNAFSTNNIEKAIPINQMIYGIYTSGSTGYPKLTMIEHKSVINLFYSIDKYAYSRLSEKKNHIVAQNAPFGFDASVQQLVCLVKGYSLCILTEHMRSSARGIIDCILGNEISVFDCTPSQLDLLLNENILEKCSEILEIILVGGESIPNNMWTRLVQEKNIDIFNMYGPTECTVDSTYYLVNGSEHEIPTIGKAIDNCNIHILDDEQNIVPIGSVGEIYISGYGVSRGYYNRDELNKKSFIKTPDASLGSSYIYKTGDKGYYLYDGNIRYLGRSDEQVKIRSHRIELAEISTNLCKHRNIKDALITVNESSGYKKLIAYLILKKENEFDPQDISNFLSDYVPRYMLPNQYIVLSKWPLNQNMKIDKKRLPMPNEIHEEGNNGVESQDELERGIAEIMMKILKIKMITDTDNFMILGGDSLRVMTLLAEIFSKYNTEIDFEEFFENPTLKFIKQKVLETIEKNKI